MFIDKELELSDGQAITADAASTNVIDMGHTQNWGAGKRLRVRVQIDEAFNTLTSMNFVLQTDTVENFASPTALVTVNQLLAAIDAIGDEFVIDIPISGVQQYLRLNYDVVGTNPTTGEVSAWVEVYDGPEGDISVIPGNL